MKKTPTPTPVPFFFSAWLLLVVIAWLAVSPAQAQVQAPNFAWARQAQGQTPDGDLDMGRSVALDSQGNSYVTGIFRGSLLFGSTQLTSLGDHDVFIAKYDPSGNVLWAKRAGSPDFEYGYDIAVDAAGNCYITGAFSGTADFDNITLISTNPLDPDIYLAKFDTNGNAVWAK